MYLGTVARIEEGGNFGNGPTIKWVWHLWTEHDKEPVVDDEGEQYEFFALSSTKLTKGSRGSSKARQWAEVLLGRDIEGMSGQEVAEAVIGKSARVTIVEKDGYPRIPEDGLSAIKSKGKTKTPSKAPAFDDTEENDADAPF